MDEKSRILTKEKLVEQRIANKEGIQSGIYYGKMGKDGAGILDSTRDDVVRNSKGTPIESVVVPNTCRWVGSSEYYEHWNKIEDALNKCKAAYDRKVNIAQFPDDYYNLIDLVRQDITRRRVEETDYTGLLTQEITNPNFSRSVALLEFLPFAGVFKEMKGSGDSVNLIQQKTGEIGSVVMHLYGLGHTRSLEDELYNLNIYSLEKVNAAVARAHTALRNNLTIGQLVAYSTAGPGGTSAYAAAQQVAADTTAGASIDKRIYLTIKKALAQLGVLYDPQTNQRVGINNAVLIVQNSVQAWLIDRVIRGQLDNSKGEVINVQSIAPVRSIWVYEGDQITVGPDVFTFNGVPNNTAYLCVPGSAGSPFYTLVKRQLTMEMGRGDVMQLAREQRAWYFAQCGYSKEFFGETAGCMSNSGFVVEITLPADEEDT